MYIFVYGTLKKGFRNARYLRDAEFICTAQSTDKTYKMISFYSEMAPGSTYPAVFNSGNANISGEVYKISSKTLRELDVLEDEGDRYLRTPINLDCDIKAEFYLSIEKDRQPMNRNISFDENAGLYTFVE